MKEPKDRYKKLLLAIEEERKNEEAYYRNLSLLKTTKQKVEAGAMLVSLVVVKKHYSVGDYIELELEHTKETKQNHFFKNGVGCKLTLQQDFTKEFMGTVSFSRKKKIGVLIKQSTFAKNEHLFNSNINVELIYDERPYRIMKNAMNDLIQSHDPIVKELRESIRNKVISQDIYKNANKIAIDEHLNESQKSAILGCASYSRLSIIHGPPGTGKTTSLVSLTKTLLQKEKKILICAPSNNAVDLLARKLSQSGIETLRVGNVSRVNQDIIHLTPIEKASKDPEWKHIKSIRIEATEARRQAEKFKRKFGVKERSNRSAMYQEARDLKKWARDLEDKLIQSILQSSQAVCCTLIGASHRMLNDLRFDTLIIDEASQALEPECWAAMLKVKRVILAGDHYQLPPTVKSAEAKKLGLERTLLSRLNESISSSFLLNEQYRMNDTLLSFSNEQFYKGKLFSNNTVANRKLVANDPIITLIDTSGCGFDEVFIEENRSRKNPNEYYILREYILEHLDQLSKVEIGVISPYGEQVRLLRSEIEEDPILGQLDIQVNSIDGFQGQEKDVIFISLVRSNDNGEIGFLIDSRRLNVAITRAKLKLVVIGDMATFAHHKIYSDLADHFENKGEYKSAWEYMTI